MTDAGTELSGNRASQVHLASGRWKAAGGGRPGKDCMSSAWMLYAEVRMSEPDRVYCASSKLDLTARDRMQSILSIAINASL